MKLNQISTDLLFVTVRIQVSHNDGTSSTGTGFIINLSRQDKASIPVLVTNQHVIKNAQYVSIELFKMNSETNEPMTEEKINVRIEGPFSQNFQSEELDIAFVPLAQLLQKLLEQKIPIYFKSVGTGIFCSKEIEENLSSIEEVIFIGYPLGIEEKSKKLPLVRRGITSTPVWTNYSNSNAQNNETFLIDAGVFPGSSGSPVFIYNQGTYSTGVNITVGTRIIFLGMLKNSIIKNDNRQFIGLGEVIKSRVIIDFIMKKLEIS